MFGSVQLVAQLAVAIGTAILAVATWRMAVRTSDMANETKRSVDTSSQLVDLTREQSQAAVDQAEHARQGLLASIQPIVVDDQEPSPGRYVLDLSMIGAKSIDLPSSAYTYLGFSRSSFPHRT